MKYRFFKIPMMSIETAETELNQFLGTHAISSIDKEFVANGENSFWAICVVYVESGKQVSPPDYKNSIDYKAVLSEEEFSVYVQLRELRRQFSQDEGIPAYAIFTNAQLADIVTQGVCS
jgi:hypothetical protein